LDAPMPSENIEAFFDEVEKKTTELRNSLEKTAAAKKELTQVYEDFEAFQKFYENVEKTNKVLQEQIDTFGMAEREVALFKLQSDAAEVPASYQEIYNEELEKTINLMDQLKGLEAKAQMKEDVKKIFEETRTPLEMYQKELEKLQKLMEAGVMDDELYGRATEAAQKRYDDALEKYEDISHDIVTTLGTFDVANAPSLQAGGGSDRLITASEATATNTREMLRELKLGGFRFQ